MLEWIARGLRTGTRHHSLPRPGRARTDGFRGRVKLPRQWSRRRLRRSSSARPERSPSPTGRCLRSTAGAAPLWLCVRRRAGPVRVRRRVTRPPPASGPRRRRVIRCRSTLERASLATARATLAQRCKRSVHIRHVDCRIRRWRGMGDPGADEPVLRHPTARILLHPLAAPRRHPARHRRRHQPMREPLRRAWETVPEPKAVIAAGTDACSGGLARRHRLLDGRC